MEEIWKAPVSSAWQTGGPGRHAGPGSATPLAPRYWFDASSARRGCRVGRLRGALCPDAVSSAGFSSRASLRRRSGIPRRGRRPVRSPRERLHHQRPVGVGLLHPALLRPHRRPRGALQLHRQTGRSRKILPGGYISWHDPVSDHWWQQVWFNADQPEFVDLGKLTARAGSLRAAIDSRTGTISRIAQSGPQSERFTAARTLTAAAKRSTSSRANGWRDRIQQLQAELRRILLARPVQAKKACAKQCTAERANSAPSARTSQKGERRATSRLERGSF
jgi:hypothetical protein